MSETIFVIETDLPFDEPRQRLDELGIRHGTGYIPLGPILLTRHDDARTLIRKVTALTASNTIELTPDDSSYELHIDFEDPKGFYSELSYVLDRDEFGLLSSVDIGFASDKVAHVKHYMALTRLPDNTYQLCAITIRLSFRELFGFSWLWSLETPVYSLSASSVKFTTRK